MMDVPKIVLVRMRKAANPGDHPDTDLLTAFAEQVLGRRERLRVIEHLSQCSDCREIVSVAQPEMTETPGSFQLMKLSLLRSPILRWSMLAVCAAVVATVTTRHFYQQKSGTFLTPEARVSTTYEAPPTAQKKADDLVAKLESPRPKLDSALSRRLAKQSTGRAEIDLKALAVADEKSKKDSLPNAVPPTAPSPTLPSKSNDHERRDQYVPNDGSMVEKPASGAATNEAVGAMNETVMVENHTASVEVAQATPGKAKEEKASRMKAPAAASAVGGAVEGVTANKAVESEYAIDLRAGLVPIPRWNLSPQGRLQRSFDGGKSWETIPLSDKAMFRAVAAVGPEIWVGGDAGTLYRSHDSGQHWTQVRPTVNGESLTADIIGIEFTDSRQGKLTTSGHESWTTSDAGETWTRNK
jgi:Photosynthesis system II assembly factor YCF48/Putative zinc-finger